MFFGWRDRERSVGTISHAIEMASELVVATDQTVEPVMEPKTVEELTPIAGYPGWVYVLRLENSCWYIGYSGDLEVRIAQHFLGRGSIWTRRNPPISVVSVQPGDTILESTITIAYMCKYSWRTVRGGKYVAEKMVRPPRALVAAFSRSPPKPLYQPVEADDACDTDAKDEMPMCSDADTGVRDAVVAWLEK